MRLNTRSNAPRWRTIAVLAVGIAIGTSMMATPAASHITSSVAHVRDHMKLYFFTKSKSDARYVRKVDARWHEVGAPGEPTFGDCGQPSNVSNYDSFHNSLAFSKDANGIVHLKGLVKTDQNVSSNCSTLFFLPPGYRPARREVHLVIKSDAPFRMNIETDGRIFAGNGVWLANEWISIDGVTFRAAG